MAYQFSNQQNASANVYRYGTDDKFKIAGVNGEQTNATNFHTAITGLLNVVGLQEGGMERTITQEVEEAP